MKYSIVITLCALTFISCKSDTVETTGSQNSSGRTTINSTTGTGFSFARGTPQPIPPFPIIDSVDDFDAGFVETGSDPTPLGLCFHGYTAHMFHLIRQFGTFDSARLFFQALIEVTDTSFVDATCQTNGALEPMTRPNQVWTVLTRHNKFAKMFIISDTSISNNPQITFDWVYQPSGSRRF